MYITQKYNNSMHCILKPRLHDTTCWQTGCQTGWTKGCIV